MDTSDLYHTQGITNFKHVRTEYRGVVTGKVKRTLFSP